MIVISKKKILLISSVIMIFIFAFVFQTAKIGNNSSVPTVSLPVSSKTIVIDAGHGVPDEGAQSSSGTTEAESNLKIALKVQNLLEQSRSNGYSN